MEFQDLNRLTEESETFTPLKVPSFQIAEDFEDADFLQKIPHGLTAKKNRRKSFHPDNANREDFIHSPQRIPLTAPRVNALNSRPINCSPMNHAKKSLINQLKSMDSGEENQAPNKLNFELHKIHNPAAVLQNITPSSPEISRNKRRSLSVELEPSRKYQKIEGLFSTDAQDDDDLILVTENVSKIFGESEDTKHDSDNDSDMEPEELSRIEAFDQTKDDELDVPTQADEISTENNEVNPNQVATIQIDDVQEGQENAANISGAPITPSRFTEPVAISPKTEQCSRIVDESGLLLDTSKSPFVDDDMAGPESPLSQHNNSVSEPSAHDKNILGCLEDLDELPEDDVLQHSALISTPKSRPFFTIAQVHEIQDDFRKETTKLEENIKEKSNIILQLNDELGSSKNKSYQLQDEINYLSLQKMQLDRQNELLKKEFDVFKGDISDMGTEIRAKDEKMARHQLVITKFKDRVKDLSNIIDDKENEIEALKDSQRKEVDMEKSFKERSDQFQKQIHHLAVTLEEYTKERKSLQEQLSVFEKYNDDLKDEIENFRNEKFALEEKLLASEQIIQQKEEEITSTNERFQSEEVSLQEVQNERAALVTQINAFSEDLEAHRNQLIEKDAELQNAQMYLQQERKKILLKDHIINGVKGGLSTLQRENLQFKSTNQEHVSVIEKLRAELVEVSELLTIRVAEVKELNYELKQAKIDNSNLQAMNEERYRIVEDLHESLQDADKALQSKESKIEELDEELQKQEGEHLAELEAFHKEMSNVQSSLSSKSNELFRLKNERDSLQGEHDLLKYELSSLKEELSNSEVRVSNLKLKLNEAKTQYQELEEQVHGLKNEKASFEKDTEKRLQQLAEDLYIQYSKKHEQKVQVLKKNYESKWQNKLAKAETESERLRGEIEGLNSQLERERAEKNHIIKLWDQQRENEGSGLAN